MKVQILGICGTFMAGVALVAKEAGWEVSGVDQHVYPPMSDLLESNGIELQEGYENFTLDPCADSIIIGNALSRGNPALEAVLSSTKKYTSGPEWLFQHVLSQKKVLAVAGTHGKTSTSSMLAWICEVCGQSPGFLIGGVPLNFNVSARLGHSDFFIIEADEYDTVFYDKRPKFLHYRPDVLVLNNLEFDHADIYDNLQAIQRQFCLLNRTVSCEGVIIANGEEAALDEVLRQGVWSATQAFGEQEKEWTYQFVDEAGCQFKIFHHEQCLGEVSWELMGTHNAMNALAAIAASVAAGLSGEQAVQALCEFKGIKRRLEKFAEVEGVSFYDDFAHHPTAIRSTLEGLRAKYPNAKLHVAMEFASYTMRSGVHQKVMDAAFSLADSVHILKPEKFELSTCHSLYPDVTALIEGLVPCLEPGDHVVIMSNRGFDNIYSRLPKALAEYCCE